MNRLARILAALALCTAAALTPVLTDDLAATGRDTAWGSGQAPDDTAWGTPPTTPSPDPTDGGDDTAWG